jgi:adhesin/invasin
VNAVNGVATFSGLSINLIGANKVLTATSGALTTTSNTFAITAAAASTIEVNAGNGQIATVGTAVATAPSVIVRDALTNPVAGVSVTFARGANVGAVTDTVTTTNASGIATVGSWTLGTTAGANTLTATATGLTGSPVTFTATGTAGTASQLAFTTQPSASTVAGAQFGQQPVVTIRDASGNTVTTSSAAVELTLSTGSGVLSGTTTVNAVNGVATFSGLSVNLIGTDKVLTAASSGLTSATSNAFTITAGAATQIAVNGGNNQSAEVGTAVITPPSVIVRDANNNPVSGVSVTFARAANVGAVTDTVTTTNASGIATVGSWTLGTTAGANTLTASSGSLTGSPVTFTATGTAGTASQLAFTTQPAASTAAGVAFAQQPVVTIRDANGNTVTTSTDAVTLTLTTGSGALSGTATVNAVNGIATFSGLSINLIGANKVLTATSNALTTTSNAFAITAAAASTIAVNGGNGQSATVGTAVATAPSVIVRDALTNPVAGISVTFAVTAGNGALVGENATTDANGIAALTSWTLGAIAGTNTVTATSGSLTGSPVTFTATGTAGTATQLAFTTQPAASTVADVAFAPQPVVTIRDANGNTVTTSTDLVTLTLTTGSGTLSGTAAVNAVNGVATFSGLSINLIGTNKVLTATSNALTTTSNTFTITAGAATQMSVNAGNTQTATVNTAVAIAPSVLVRDANNNPVAGVEVTFAIVSGGGSLGAPVATTDASGVATLGSWTLGTTAGANSISASATGLTSVTFTATGTAAAATQLVFTTQPGNGVVNTQLSDFVVEARDANGNLDTTFTGSVTLDIVSGSGTLLGTLVVSAIAGVATFSDIEVDTAQVGLVLRVQSAPLTAASANPITIDP